MLVLISRWFEQSAGAQDYTRAQYALLGLVLAVGAWLRFWNLGYASLHGDEDIMGLAARGVLEHGVPMLPSEFIYMRALAHVYLLAGSIQIFGDSEWSLRLPSAIIGSLCGLFAFFAGKRFLDPKPNLMFVVLITFLPVMIEISQTGRMYVFLVAGLLVFAALLFRWEKTGGWVPLLLAFSVWALTVHFHALAVFAAPLFLFPGLANRSWKQLSQGVVALLLGLVIFHFLSEFSALDMPSETERLVTPDEVSHSPLGWLWQGYWTFVIGCAAGAVILVLSIGTIGIVDRMRLLPAVLLLGFGVLSCALLHYHIGAIALVFGVIAWYRAGEKKHLRLIVLAAGLTLMALAQVYILHRTGEFPGRKIIGALVGTPSIWPVLRFAQYSPIAVLAYLGVLGFAVLRLGQGRPLPVHFLFFAISVWAVLLAIGVFTWDTAPRYTLGVLPFFLLCLSAGLWYVLQNTPSSQRFVERPAVAGLGLLMLAAVLIQPVAAWDVARNDYRTHPDHKGAAEFIKRLNLAPTDILIAEDSINQTYYLGRVDYRLLNVDVAKSHSVVVQGVLRGQYTGSPVIGTGSELEEIIDARSTAQIYIIGSGENFEDGRRHFRGNGIQEVLESGKLEVIYHGRDGKTKVWKLRDPQPGPRLEGLGR